jgi:hypothetical protein
LAYELRWGRIILGKVRFVAYVSRCPCRGGPEAELPTCV